MSNRGPVIRPTRCAQGRPPRTPEKVHQDFLDKIEKMPSGCWEYRGTIDKTGYGLLQVGKRQWRAHRWMYVQTYGEVDPVLFICHKCDNRPCVNPEHLYAGTVKDNASDVVVRDRIKGMRNGHCKLTDDDVLEIRRAYAANEMSQNQLAARFNIGQSSISEILLGTKWVHVGGPRKAPEPK